MNLEKQLYDSYHADPDQLQKNMNHENLIILCQLADQTENDITLQIIGSLVSTYIDQNHQQIVEFLKIFEFSWNRIKRFTTQTRPVYHFFSSIISNIILHFYDQLPVQFFKEQAQTLNKQVYLIIIDTVLRRLQPQDRNGEFRILDSKQRIVRQQFLKHNLDFILEIIITSLSREQTQDLHMLDNAINLLNLLLETEIKQDHMEKDWHKLSRVEVKNRRNLQTIMKEIKYQILEQQILEKMIQNSHLDHMDPNANHIKQVWGIVKHQQFIAKLTELLPLSLKIWESLGKICKIYQKFYSTDQQSIQIVQQITANIMISDLTKINICNLLNFAGKTLFANHSPEWLEFNFNLIRQLSTIDTVCVGLKFLRNFVRFQRQYDYSCLHQIMMPIIAGFFNQWVLINNTWLNDKLLRNNINHIIKEISCIMIEQYLDFFAQIMQSNVALNVKEYAFKYYQIGLFASIQSTTYHLDVINKLQFYKMDQIFFPINQQIFQQLKYQELYSKAFDFAFLYLNNNAQSKNKFYYKIWKCLFNQQALIKFEEILMKMQTERRIIFNFNQIFQFEDQELIRKSLKVLSNSRIRMEEQYYQINLINIPKECFSEFQQFRMIQNQKILTLYHLVKMSLLNAQNESTNDQIITDLLITEFKCQLQTFLDQLQDNINVVFILQSMLNDNARSLYGIVMQIVQERGYLKQFSSAINFDLLKLTRMMISTSNYIGQLKQPMVDDIYEWILLIIQKVIQHLEQCNNQFTQERQLGQKNFQNIYKLYYKPLIMLLKIIQNLKHLNKLMTSKKQVRSDIYSLMLTIFKFINLNDLSTYMHKMSSLFYSIQWILEFEATRKLITDETFGIILDFLNCALLIQEKKTLFTTLKIVQDLQQYEQFRNLQYIQQRMVAENCLFGAFLYNIRISDISGIMLKYFQKMPNDFYTLFTKLKSRMQPYKSFEWDQLLNVKLDKLYQIIPKQCQIVKMSAKNSQLEKMFTDYFYQIQLFYNYFP